MNAQSRTARRGAPLVVALSLLSLSAMGCAGGAAASPQAGDEHRGDEAMVGDDTGGGDEGAEGEAADGLASNASGARPIVSCASAPTARDPYQIRSRSVDGDVLQVVVTHGGGCEQHDFHLCYEPVFLETAPVQVNLQLAHDAHGDQCRRIDRKVLEFDLSPLRDHYRAAYPDGDTIVLNLGESITYEL